MWSRKNISKALKKIYESIDYFYRRRDMSIKNTENGAFLIDTKALTVKLF